MIKCNKEEKPGHFPECSSSFTDHNGLLWISYNFQYTLLKHVSKGRLMRVLNAKMRGPLLSTLSIYLSYLKLHQATSSHDLTDFVRNCMTCHFLKAQACRSNGLLSKHSFRPILLKWTLSGEALSMTQNCGI